MKTKKLLTNKELCNMPDGTKIRIKASVDCHSMYHTGGVLSIDFDDLCPGDYPWGIVVNKGICKEFKAADYELI